MPLVDAFSGLEVRAASEIPVRNCGVDVQIFCPAQPSGTVGLCRQ